MKFTRSAVSANAYVAVWMIGIGIAWWARARVSPPWTESVLGPGLLVGFDPPWLIVASDRAGTRGPRAGRGRSTVAEAMAYHEVRLSGETSVIRLTGEPSVI